MGTVVCVGGSVLVGSQCLSTCPPNFVPLLTDKSTCVSTISCPLYTTEVDQVVCQKSFSSVSPYLINGICAIGTMWAPERCYYPDCSAPFIENGFSCLKRTLTRTPSEPFCSSLFFTFDGSSCKNLSIFSWVGLFAASLAIFYMLTRPRDDY
jgi:hypothetical protein